MGQTLATEQVIAFGRRGGLYWRMVKKFSHSSLGTFRNCPRQFKFQYIDKVAIPRRVFAHLQLGTIVHRQLAWLYRASSDGVEIAGDELLRRSDEDWAKLDPAALEVSGEYLGVDDYVENGRRMLRTFYERYRPFRSGALIGVEMGIDFTLPETPFVFRSIVDRALKLDNGVLEIADYKTGGGNLPAADDPAFRTQMGLYQLAMQTKHPQFREIELVQYWLKHDEEVRTRLRPDELDELIYQLKDEVLATRLAEQLDDWPTKESTLCNYCDYFKLCPAKRHRLMLETESDSDKTTALAASELADRYITVHEKSAQLKAEEEALKEDLKRVARDLAVEKLTGRQGDVLVKLGSDQKLPTKSADPKAFAEVTNLIRQWGPDYEAFFKLDGDAVMKELYQKGRLDDAQRKALDEFVVVKDRSRITVRRRDAADDDED